MKKITIVIWGFVFCLFSFISITTADELSDANTFITSNRLQSPYVSTSNLYGKVLRREAAVVLWKFVTFLARIPTQSCQTPNDLGNLSQTEREEIVLGCKHWLFKSTLVFNPNDPFTRWQLIIVIARFLTANPRLELDEAYNTLLSKWIIKVDDRAISWRSSLRNEVYLMLYRMRTNNATGGNIFSPTQTTNQSSTITEFWKQCVILFKENLSSVPGEDRASSIINSNNKYIWIAVRNGARVDDYPNYGVLYSWSYIGTLSQYFDVLDGYVKNICQPNSAVCGNFTFVKDQESFTKTITVKLNWITKWTYSAIWYFTTIAANNNNFALNYIDEDINNKEFSRRDRHIIYNWVKSSRYYVINWPWFSQDWSTFEFVWQTLDSNLLISCPSN